MGWHRYVLVVARLPVGVGTNPRPNNGLASRRPIVPS